MRTDDGGTLRLAWFNQPFRSKDLKSGGRFLATGVLKPTGVSWEIVHPTVVKLDDGETPEDRKPLPIYPLTEGLPQALMRKIFQSGINKFIESVDEVLPERIRDALGVLSIHAALQQIHWPDSIEAAQAARNRFVSQECSCCN